MKTILIADEDEKIRNVIRLMFEHMGYEVVATKSGMDTILKTKKIKPDIVLADVSLSEKNGYAISREIKNDLLLKSTPVILLASSLGTFDESKAAEVHADDFIIKPFVESREITKKIEFLISQNERKRTKIRLTDIMLILLVSFVIAVPILYQSVSSAKVESKLKQLYTQFNGLSSASPSKFEPKLILPVEREKNIAITVNNDRWGIPRKRGSLIVKEKKPEMKNEEPVKVKAEAEEKDASAMPTTQLDGKYTVQIGAFQTEEKAQRIAESLIFKGYPVFIKTAGIPGRGIWYMIRIGTFKTREEAKIYGDNLKNQEPSIKELVVVSDIRKEKRKKPTFEQVRYRLLEEMKRNIEEKEYYREEIKASQSEKIEAPEELKEEVLGTIPIPNLPTVSQTTNGD